jgi:transcriptional regulator with XRE-family HTH domain
MYFSTLVMKQRLERLMLETKAWADQERGRQKELARYLGVSRQALSNWLSRRQDPPAHVALELQDLMRRKKAPRKARQDQEEELFVT